MSSVPLAGNIECTVYGSYGSMTVDRYTGLVLAYKPDLEESAAVGNTTPGGAYADIFRFDTDTGATPLPTGHTDIIRTGFWTTAGTYEPRCLDPGIDGFYPLA